MTFLPYLRLKLKRKWPVYKISLVHTNKAIEMKLHLIHLSSMEEHLH